MVYGQQKFFSYSYEEWEVQGYDARRLSVPLPIWNLFAVGTLFYKEPKNSLLSGISFIGILIPINFVCVLLDVYIHA